MQPPVPDPELSVVIPALDEAEHLGRLLNDLAELPVRTEIVVVDGGSRDATTAVAASATPRIVRSSPGRARQMNRGALEASAQWLLFLHADTRLPPVSAVTLADFLRAPRGAEAAHFRFRLEAEGVGWRLLELIQGVRERLTGLAYGDQGLLVSRRRWEELGGFPEIPVMEDVEAVRRLRRFGGLRRLDAPLLTSPRRYREEGIPRALIRNACLISLYVAGTHPDRLAKWYRPRRITAEPPAATTGRAGSRSEGNRVRAHPSPPPPKGKLEPPATLMIFVKAPRPGEVKTRLAREFGDERAARIYRTMGRRIVDRLRRGHHRTIVHFTPPDALEEVREWLGGEGLEYRPQVGGSLGARMAAAFDHAFREAEKVCIVGTDSPDLTRETVELALAHLSGAREGADRDRSPTTAVLGPALDGGYYLLALNRPAPSLFRDIPWGTDAVLEQTLERARELDIHLHTLAPLADVDRPEDVPAGLLEEGSPG
jgi:rSAM/selenodomain-associated transferase 2/rSAM/selenodomain-associated transferase 1